MAVDSFGASVNNGHDQFNAGLDELRLFIKVQTNLGAFNGIKRNCQTFVQVTAREYTHLVDEQN
ncbi:hypothetical protein BpHYR1_040886 [Brachionus plicatilis]|uniref:Uncharacterized protein n=1 Tax=Brachionus plicatilis TaxID=10195 RepID=A0A3M7RRY9_BRAPC|nr:hypothetical protein BpHYR1_040886 [Brachionus plicatilis]